MAGMPELRRYQLEIARAVFGSVLLRRGLTFTVEIARQGGKNEVSAPAWGLAAVVGEGRERGREIGEGGAYFQPASVG